MGLLLLPYIVINYDLIILVRRIYNFQVPFEINQVLCSSIFYFVSKQKQKLRINNCLTA